MRSAKASKMNPNTKQKTIQSDVSPPIQRLTTPNMIQTKVFSEHLHELRNRIFNIVACVLISSIIGYQFYDQLLKFVLAPLHQTVYYSSPLGGLNFSFQLSFMFGLFVSFPILLYHVFRFTAPALSPAVERRLWPLFCVSLILMLLGVLFSYFVGLPMALTFLGGFSSSDIRSLISATDYFTFATRYLFGFGLLFQLPIVLIIINFIRPLRVRTLLTYQRHAILCAFILSLILSPAPDPLNMTLMALPLIALFYISLCFLALLNHRNKKTTISAIPRTHGLSTSSSVFLSIFYFVMIALASALFGLAFFFSVATYQNIKRNHLPLHTVLVFPTELHVVLDRANK